MYAFADGTYFTVIYNGEGCKMPILAMVGITETGEREVLAFSVGDRENEQAWKDLLEDLKQQGVTAIDLWISDGNQAMLTAITKKFPTSARQRCVVHKMDNDNQLYEIIYACVTYEALSFCSLPQAALIQPFPLSHKMYCRAYL